MTTVTIDYPTWDQVREGDLVTYEFGTPGKAGYTQRINNVTNYREELTISTVPLRSWEDGHWHIIKIVREVPDPLPDHAGAQVFTDRGVERSDGCTDYRWSIAGENKYLNAGSLSNPVEALPVPAKELRELMDLMKKHPTLGEVNWGTTALIDATHREWNRAGIEESI